VSPNHAPQLCHPALTISRRLAQGQRIITICLDIVENRADLFEMLVQRFDIFLGFLYIARKACRNITPYTTRPRKPAKEMALLEMPIPSVIKCSTTKIRMLSDYCQQGRQAQPRSLRYCSRRYQKVVWQKIAVHELG
jgi:hypothetical protein